MFFHTRRFREPERRYRTESLGDTLRPSCRSSSLGRPRSGDSFTRGRLWRGKDTLILLPSRLPSLKEKKEERGRGRWCFREDGTGRRTREEEAWSSSVIGVGRGETGCARREKCNPCWMTFAFAKSKFRSRRVSVMRAITFAFSIPD